MRTLPWASLVAAVVLAGACSNPTGIVVEVRWDPAQLPPTADTLHVYVGAGPATITADLTRWDLNPGSAAVALPTVTAPYRYLLSPDGDLAGVGELRLAAAITAPGDDGRPVRAVAYGDGGTIRFAAEEVRVVTIDLLPGLHLVGGPAGECVLLDDGVIGQVGDADCDGVADDLDCGRFDPRNTTVVGADDDQDGFACGDCFDTTGPKIINGWSIDPATVFPGQTEGAFRLANQIPATVDCLHVDFACKGWCGADPDAPATGDTDDSGADTCGQARVSSGIACDTAPSDCDEEEPGDTMVPGESEFCDGRDSNCDGRPSPDIPCALPAGPTTSCDVGVHTCDDTGGRISSCHAVPGDVRLLDDTTSNGICAQLQNMAGCFDDEDPLACQFDAVQCDVPTADEAGCPQTSRLSLPPFLDPNGMCDWRVIGGTQQADWDVGFGDVQLASQTDACAPQLVVKAAHADPRPRTVMLTGRPRMAGAPARAFFVKLKPGGACGDPIQCDGPLVP